MVDENQFKTEKRTEDSMNCHSSNMTSEWPYNCDIMPGSSMRLSSGAACEVNGIGSSSCASDPMMNSCPDSWSRPAVEHDMGPNVGNNFGSSIMLEHIRGGSEAMRPMFDGGWNPMMKGGLFLPNGPVVHPRNLSQFPADSGFIERAARFSCFASGNFSDMVAPFTAPESVSPYSKSRPVVGGPNIGNALRPLSFENEVSGGQGDASLPWIGSVPRSFDDARQGRGASSNESEEANIRGTDGHEEPSMLDGAGGENCSTIGYGGNKRKRAAQSARASKVNGASQKSSNGAKFDVQNQQRSEPNLSPGSSIKASEKPEQNSQGADTGKEEYIHVRARRGQATNSHSLAERVRREKISERMKFLQDLVPGCCKVTGKAVMLDEIINYVQSLQRQVEFLSMKLATVNPRLDIDIESLITKDMFQQRAGPSSSLGFPSDVAMGYPHLTPQPSQFQASLPISGNSSDLRKTMSTHLASMRYKEPDSQIPNMWDDDLHNVVNMGFGNSSEPVKSQELNDSHQSGSMKSEQ